MIAIFRDIAATDNMEDGIAFDRQSVHADSIRDDNRYGGLRVRLNGRIDTVRRALRIDVGFGAAATPEAQTVPGLGQISWCGVAAHLAAHAAEPPAAAYPARRIRL